LLHDHWTTNHESVDSKPERADEQIDSKDGVGIEGDGVGDTLSLGTITKAKNELKGKEPEVKPSEDGVHPMSLTRC
jgi:hypothetical protein